jgi:hypothetical protein
MRTSKISLRCKIGTKSNRSGMCASEMRQLTRRRKESPLQINEVRSSSGYFLRKIYEFTSDRGKRRKWTCWRFASPAGLWKS